MIARICVCGLVALFAVTGASAATKVQPLTAHGVQAALIKNGYPARTQCGEVMEPRPPLRAHGRIFTGHFVPACAVVVERDGFSVRVTPRSSAAAAKLAYQQRNPSATQSREAAIGYVLVTGFRIPKADWLRISHVVSSAIAHG